MIILKLNIMLIFKMTYILNNYLLLYAIKMGSFDFFKKQISKIPYEHLNDKIPNTEGHNILTLTCKFGSIEKNTIPP